MVERLTESRGGVKGGIPLAGSRDSVPCGVWGNAPTVPRATSMLNALNQGAGSEASLPVTLRSRRSALQLHIRPLTYCRARWARPTSMGNDLFSRCWSFLLQEVSPLRRRVGGFAVAPLTPSVRTTVVGFYRCKENCILNITAKTIIEIARGFPPHFSISITLRLNTARPWFFLSVRKRLSVFSSTAMSIGLERCMSMPASKLC